MNKEENKKSMGFFRRNIPYFVLAFCILAIGVSIALVIINQNGKKPTTVEIPSSQQQEEPVIPQPVDPFVEETVEFIMPVSNAERIEYYSETAVYSSTLSRYTAHLATDFFAPEGTSVCAVYGGEVESIDNDLLTGYTVTIDHGNGLKTSYNSLSEDICVSVGDKLNKGDVIGEVSVSNRKEYKEGAHLHFEVMESGKIIDPVKYLDFDNK